MNDISHEDLESVIFAGGCFWCVEVDFKKRPAIADIESGYIGGDTADPDYDTAGQEGHREAVRVWYDPAETNYRQLLAYFFTIHDPTDAGGSFHDRGHTYTSAIYYENDRQKAEAEEVVATLNETNVFEKDITTDICSAETFWPAEVYHQNYAKKNPAHYSRYRSASGRDDFKRSHKESVYNALDI